MSRVTNIILSVETLDIIEDQQVLLINEYFENKEIRGFVSMEDPMLPKRWYGGSKFLEARIYLGAFNYLELDELIEHIRSIAWPGPTSVQLLVKDQEESIFTPIQVVEHGWGD